MVDIDNFSFCSISRYLYQVHHSVIIITKLHYISIWLQMTKQIMQCHRSPQSENTPWNILEQNIFCVNTESPQHIMLKWRHNPIFCAEQKMSKHQFIIWNLSNVYSVTWYQVMMQHEQTKWCKLHTCGLL